MGQKMKELDITKNGRTKTDLIHAILHTNYHFPSHKHSDYEPCIYLSEDALRVIKSDDIYCVHKETIADTFKWSVMGIKVFKSIHLDGADFKIGWFLKEEKEPMRFIDDRAMEILEIKPDDSIAKMDRLAKKISDKLRIDL